MPEKMKYVIEHMEQGFTPWVILEYSQIIKDVGKENLFLVSLPSSTTEKDIPKQLLDLGLQWTTQDIVPYLMETNGISNKDDLCLLDPKAEIELQPSDASNFKYFIFGGILGDHPPRDRTSELKNKLKCTTRRLGNLQMTTDTAVRTTKIILEDQIPFDKIKFIDYPEIRFNKHEATEMPFRYVLNNNGIPIFPEGMIDLIHKDNQKSLDDFF
jgi:ribosome biogenesis SPOUT family RNA methylase Rps3